MQVKCTECGYESNRSDLFIDLSLDIDHASTITRALQRYTAPEILDGANKYFCKRHRAKMRARKCMTIDSGPPVLILQLKRFAFAGFGLSGMSSKIHRKVRKCLDLHWSGTESQWRQKSGEAITTQYEDHW